MQYGVVSPGQGGPDAIHAAGPAHFWPDGPIASIFDYHLIKRVRQPIQLEASPIVNYSPISYNMGKQLQYVKGGIGGNECKELTFGYSQTNISLVKRVFLAFK